MDPPEWMNKLFFEKALRNHEKDDNAVITTFQFIPIEKASRNLYSAIFRVRLSYKTLRHKKAGDKVLLVVIKIPVQQVEFSEEFIKEAPLFKTEMNMYNRSLIDIDQVLMASGIRPTLFPKVIYISHDPRAIVLKDIETEGFYDAKLPPANLDDSKVIFKRLAKFHAASYFLTEQLYMDLSLFNYSVYQADEYVENVLRNTLRAFKQSMLKWKPESNEKYVEKIDYLVDNIARIGTKFYSMSKPHQGYNVLNHGDCHLGNMMLKYDKNGGIDDVCFIDFQLAIYASPAVDLIHCFTVLSEENRNNHFDEIVAYYHSEFVDMLKKMGFLKPPPSLLDLHIELLRYGALSTIIGICFIPHVLAAKYLSDDDLKLEGLDLKQKIFDLEEFKRIIEKDLERMLRKGFI